MNYTEEQKRQLKDAFDQMKPRAARTTTLDTFVPSDGLIYVLRADNDGRLALWGDVEHRGPLLFPSVDQANGFHERVIAPLGRGTWTPECLDFAWLLFNAPADLTTLWWPSGLKLYSTSIAALRANLPREAR